MCESLMPAVYNIMVLHPHAGPGESVLLLDASFLTASILALLIALISLRSTEVGREVGRTGALTTAIIFCALITACGFPLGESVCQELVVVGPNDNILGGEVKAISQSYSDANDVAVNITLVRGRENVQKEVMKNNSKADIVILEKEYPLFNLSGMEKLQKKGRIENYTYLYSERVLMIVGAGKPIGSLQDLSGMRISVTDQHVPGACLAEKILDLEDIEATEVTVPSNEAQLDAVAEGSADATVLWESMFETYNNSTSPDIKAIDLPEYRMDNYIAVLNSSEDNIEAERYASFLVDALADLRI
jgi:hypothetical protein